jgi:hypothetical protein
LTIEAFSPKIGVLLFSGIGLRQRHLNGSMSHASILTPSCQMPGATAGELRLAEVSARCEPLVQMAKKIASLGNAIA